MIIDLPKFVAQERPTWTELERWVDRLESDPGAVMTFEDVNRFHYLFERTSAGLGKVVTFSSEPELRRYLEHLVARAYGEIHETRENQRRIDLAQWFLRVLPTTFRRHVRAFWLSVGITLVGCAFGVLALALDPESKEVIMPFSHLLGDPAERVAREEHQAKDAMQGQQSGFSTMLMTHNTKVAMTTLALGMTWGIGTIIVLFYNGVILGAVALDYVRAGQLEFLLGWLMPHGAIEIPAILIAGQAGLVLATALIGWGKRVPLEQRLREISGDLVTLILGVALLLVWAGLVEAFISQYHQPALPYAVKIAFGVVEMTLLILFLAKAGAQSEPTVSTTG